MNQYCVCSFSWCLKLWHSFYLSVAANAGEVCAVLCLDKKKVANTEWKSPSNAAWEQQFKIDLDKVC